MTNSEQARVQMANVLLVNFLSLVELVVMAGGGHFFEHPRDAGPPYPSAFGTELVMALEKRINAKRLLLDQ